MKKKMVVRRGVETDVDADLERMRREYKSSARKNSPGEKGSSDSVFLTLPEGKTILRILPRDGTPVFYTMAAQHFRVGDDGRTIRCIGKLDDEGRPQYETKCPICRRFLAERGKNNKKYQRGNEKGKAEYLRIKNAYYPKLRYYANVLTRKGEVKVLAYGEMISEKLLRYYFDDDFKLQEDITSPTEGHWLKITRKGTDRLTRYEVILPVGELAAPSAVKNWKALAGQRHDLEADAILGEKLSVEAIRAALRGIEFDDEESDEESEDEDGEEEESEDEDGEEEEESEDEDGEETEDEDGEETEDEAETKAKVEAKPTKAKAKPKSVKPTCYGSPDDHDPDDETCIECPWFARCAKEPEVARLVYNRRIEAA